MPEVRNFLILSRGNSESVSKSEFDFPNNIRRSWDKLLKRIGIEDFRWHDLRQCCASYLRQDRKSLGIIGSHLGHKDAPVQRVIRILVEKRLLRLEQPYLRNCMAECRQKCRQMGSRASQALQLQGLREQGIWFESPFSHQISVT